MEWPTSSSQPFREDTHPDSLSIDPFLFPRSPAVPETYQASSIPANQLNWASTSVTGFPIGIEPHGWTVPPTGVSDGGGIPLQRGVAQAHSSYDEICAQTLDALYTSGGQPEMLANAHTNSALVAPNRVASRQSDKAPERTSVTPCSAHGPPVFECKWDKCPSTTRFSTQGDLVRHLKSIHISPDAYSCLNCGRSFGRKDHLRDHQKRRHRGLV